MVVVGGVEDQMMVVELCCMEVMMSVPLVVRVRTPVED